MFDSKTAAFDQREKGSNKMGIYKRKLFKYKLQLSYLGSLTCAGDLRIIKTNSLYSINPWLYVHRATGGSS